MELASHAGGTDAGKSPREFVTARGRDRSDRSGRGQSRRDLNGLALAPLRCVGLVATVELAPNDQARRTLDQSAVDIRQPQSDADLARFEPLTAFAQAAVLNPHLGREAAEPEAASGRERKGPHLVAPPVGYDGVKHPRDECGGVGVLKLGHQFSSLPRSVRGTGLSHRVTSMTIASTTASRRSAIERPVSESILFSSATIVDPLAAAARARPAARRKPLRRCTPANNSDICTCDRPRSSASLSRLRSSTCWGAIVPSVTHARTAALVFSQPRPMRVRCKATTVRPDSANRARTVRRY